MKALNWLFMPLLFTSTAKNPATETIEPSQSIHHTDMSPESALPLPPISRRF